jgi:hypothetical protein
VKRDAASRVRIGSRLVPQLTIAAVLLAIAGFAAPSALAAESERVLEPRLSLTGGCGTSVDDPVPDPGPCPLENEGGPGVPGVDHPPAAFSDPRAVATDLFGNIYVSSFGNAPNGSKGRIDIFCSDGTYISELVTTAPTSLAVDSEGHLYVYSKPTIGSGQVRVFDPNLPYQPQACEIDYPTTPSKVVVELSSLYSGLAINHDDDHLFVNVGNGIAEYTSAVEGNEEVRNTPGPAGPGGAGMAIDAERDRMYAGSGLNEARIDIWDLNSVVGTPPDDEYEKIGEILPSSVPAGDFGTQLSIAVDEGNGNVFVLDGENCRLYEFEEDGTYLQTIDADFLECNSAGEISVDNGPTSPNGKLSEEADEGRFLYVPSHRPPSVGHSFAFFISTVGPPEVSEPITVANVSEDEAELRAQIDPNNLPTTYTFELKVEGAASWTPVGGGTLPGVNDALPASAVARGLTPGTNYVFRVVASNKAADPVNGGEDEAEGSFATYPSLNTEPEPCPNALLRTGPSALLPDCRAYELVTPPDTNARAPQGVARQGGVFPTRQVSPVGDKIPFRVEGGSLPGLGGTGSLLGDPYLATRTGAGWSTAYTGPSAEEARDIAPGANSPDQSTFNWEVSIGSAALDGPDPDSKGNATTYVRYPDGHSELLGRGSLGKVDPESAVRMISAGGGHIIFTTGSAASPATAVQLEPTAAPSGTAAIYDRAPNGTNRVVSLKPGDVPFGAGENAEYQGASLDGVGVAFKVAGTLYLRYNNEETFTIGTGAAFAGVAEGGSRVFYLQGGNLLRFDALAPEGQKVTPFATTGDADPVLISADSSTAYFVSESVLGGANPQGDSAQLGAQNLYRSVEGQIDFVATVTDRDVEGGPNGVEITDGLGLWVEAASSGKFGRVAARTTPNGSALLFKSRAALTDYDPAGHAQIYRYAAGELDCLSCIPTGAAASSDATLQTEFREGQDLFSSYGWPENLRADGRRAFFESSEALVASDSDGLRDVYEWEDQGVGSCTRAGGCVYLISSPQSLREEYLWAVSPSGEDVFFLSSELLVGADADQTPSIYDARVGGGFAEPVPRVCEGEGCRPQLTPPPPLPSALTPVLGAGDNVKPAKRCGKGKRKVKRAGKVRCVKKKRNRAQGKKNRAGAGKKGGRR